MSSGSTTKQDTSTNPWAVQTPFLTDAFTKAQNANNNAYTGDRVAQFNPDQLATFQKMVGAGNLPFGQDQANAGGAFVADGQNAATGALKQLGAFTPQGGTASNIAAANQYADAAASPAAVAAAMRDATRQVSEQALPQIARQSAATGNTMSSRRGVAEGIVERGLADKTADTSATMHANAFNSGLGLAEQNSEANNNAILDALKSSGALGTGAVGTGTNLTNSGVTNIGQLLGMSAAGGAGQRDAGQAGLDNSIAKSDSAFDNLMKYYGIVGGNNWGGTSHGESTKTPSIWEIMGGLMSAGGQAAKFLA